MGSEKNSLSLLASFKMGRVRTKTIKKAARVIIEKYYTKLTLDFHTNKRIIEEVALIPSKPLRNKIAGFITHLRNDSNGLQCVEFLLSCKKKNVSAEITTSPTSQLWNKTSLKSILRLRTC